MTSIELNNASVTLLRSFFFARYRERVALWV
jgi:hypothetical protein